MTGVTFPEDAPSNQEFHFTLHGVELRVPRAILTPELWRAFTLGYYEGSEISALRNAIRPGDHVLEIGGGIGFISSFILKELGAASVHTIEADLQLISIIQATHALNGVSARITHAAAGPRDGYVTFHKQPSFWASSVVELPGGTPTRVPAVGIHRLVEDEKPDVLVVDIEGGEQYAFAGAALSSVRTVIVEVHQPQIGGSGIDRCFSALASAGFAYNPDGSGGSNIVFSRFTQPRLELWDRMRRLLNF
ncbi:MAG: FkbM family methyltransferase [Thiobacillaceae bacterium]|nr:FkbM family methyltransferase [Thiobacillaceae bacterium]